MSLHREEKQPKAMDTSIKVALIGAAATLVAAVITASVSWQQQPSAAQEKRVQVGDGRHKDRLPTPSDSQLDIGKTDESTPKTVPAPASPSSRESSNLTLDRILDILQHHRQRATFGAVAGALGREPLNLFDGYPRTPRTAWVVSKGTGQPTGQKQSELPPDLFTNAHVITTREELLRWIEQKK